jgi:hypothetical protein
MTEARRLEAGALWLNQWSQTKVEVLEVDLEKVRFRHLDSGDEKTCLVEQFMKTYVNAD